MQKIEFEQRTGINLTDDEYKNIEMMYLECGNIDKDDFCKDYKKHKDSVMIDIFFHQSQNQKEKLSRYNKERSLMVDFLLERAQAFGDIELLSKAIQLVGHQEVIKRKIQKDLPLWDDDKKYIYNNIK